MLLHIFQAGWEYRADQSIQQTDAVVRINGTKADTAARFRVWIKLTKVVFS